MLDFYTGGVWLLPLRVRFGAFKCRRGPCPTEPFVPTALTAPSSSGLIGARRNSPLVPRAAHILALRQIEH
jgi:hypothetical protein